MREQFGVFSDEVGAAAQEVTRGTLLLRVNMRLRQHAASQQNGDLVRVDSAVLGLTAVDRFIYNACPSANGSWGTSV